MKTLNIPPERGFVKTVTLSIHQNTVRIVIMGSFSKAAKILLIVALSTIQNISFNALTVTNVSEANISSIVSIVTIVCISKTASDAMIVLDVLISKIRSITL